MHAVAVAIPQLICLGNELHSNKGKRLRRGDALLFLVAFVQSHFLCIYRLGTDVRSLHHCNIGHNECYVLSTSSLNGGG